MSHIDDIDLGGTARSPDDVRNLQNLGLQFAEITITDPGKFSDQVKAYKELKVETGLYYLCHGPREGDPNDTGSLEKKYLPKVFDILPIMVDLGMPLLTLHLWLDPRFVKQGVIDFKIEMLARVINRAEDKGLTICIENLSENASHLSKAFNDLPQLYLTLDIGHAQLLTQNNLSCEIMETFPERIRHVHLHDNLGGESYLDDLHLPPGNGIIDFDSIFKGLALMGYDRSIGLELKIHEIRDCLGYTKELLRKLDA